MKKHFLSLLLLLLGFVINPTDGNAQIEEISKIKTAFIEAKKSFPSNQAIERSSKLTPKGKQVFKRINQVIQKGSRTTNNTSLAEFISITKEMDSLLLVLGVNPDKEITHGGMVSKRIRPQIGFDSNIINSFSEDGCVMSCKQVYDNCLLANDCSWSWICFCCQRCLLVYYGCMAACALD